MNSLENRIVSLKEYFFLRKQLIMKLSNEAIKEIAEDLDCGMICFVHKETKAVKSMIDPDNLYAEEEHWREDLDEIEREWDKYVKIDKMSSREAFQIMEAFAAQISDTTIQDRLYYALNKNKPFRNFKHEVDYNEEVRQQWFKFKATKYQEYVRTFLEFIEEEKQPKIVGYYNDDGTEYNPDLYPLPQLCMSCKKKDDSNEEIVCNLIRMDQQGEDEFICAAYEKK